MNPAQYLPALATALALVAAPGTGSVSAQSVPAPASSASAATSVSPTDQLVRFFETRVQRDPEDYAALNRLAGLYLRRAREKDDDSDFERAKAAAQASLKAVPAETNAGAIYALTQHAQAVHDFAAARDHARQLIELDPGKSDPFLLLGDALLELGDYAAAEQAFDQAEQAEGNAAQPALRRARLAVLRGDLPAARDRLSRALALIRNGSAPSPEAIAWCQWQLGETFFAEGDYATAERHYREAVTGSPGHRASLAALARARAAQGDLAGAIAGYETVVASAPHPEFTSRLGDLYALAGRPADAARQYALVENARDVPHDNRTLAVFYADQGINSEEAYRRALSEYKARQDIYTADALAWTAYKAGKIPEARKAAEQALRLGTRDARILYHAGLIARAAGDEAAARDYLRRALALNPEFDPLQAPLARKALLATNEKGRGNRQPAQLAGDRQ